jgi:hypothetical protein
MSSTNVFIRPLSLLSQSCLFLVLSLVSLSVSFFSELFSLLRISYSLCVYFSPNCCFRFSLCYLFFLPAAIAFFSTSMPLAFLLPLFGRCVLPLLAVTLILLLFVVAFFSSNEPLRFFFPCLPLLSSLLISRCVSSPLISRCVSSPLISRCVSSPLISRSVSYPLISRWFNLPLSAVVFLLPL